MLLIKNGYMIDPKSGWDGNYDMEPVDGAKYRTWRESFLEGASEMDDIWFWDLKEENIAILGAEKPD